MMTSGFRRITAAVMATVMLMSPWVVHANMQNALDNMFVSVTGPSAYNSQTRMGAVGGYLSLRVPNQNINVFTLDAPRITMGCGGIDMYGGSFSFINTDQLVAVLRNIAQIAVASLFKLGLCSISKELCGTMSEFSDIMQKLNNMKMNSCKVGQYLALEGRDAIFGNMAEKTAEDQKKLDAGRGKVKEAYDWFASLFSPSGRKVTEDPDNPTGGNLTWRALYYSKAHNQIYGVKDELAASLIINVGGTWITKYDKAGENRECGANPQYSLTTPAHLCEKLDHELPGKTLTVEMLVQPQDTHEIYMFRNASASNEFGWTESYKVSVNSDEVFKGGTKALALKVLFGDAATHEFVGAPSEATGGIVHYINTGSWGDFNATGYLGSMTSPILRQLAIVQRDKVAVTKFAQENADILATDMAIQLATAIGDAANQAFSGDVAGKVQQPKDYKKNVEDFRRQIDGYRLKANERLDVQIKLNQLSATVAASLGSGAIALPGRIGRK